ncbi:autotransporter domain-containing protein [Termitidicoccus mucosus]
MKTSPITPARDMMSQIPGGQFRSAGVISGATLALLALLTPCQLAAASAITVADGVTLDVTGSIIASNTNTASSGKGGAVLVNTGGTLLGSNFLFEANATSNGAGGAVYNSAGGIVMLSGGTFTGNKASSNASAVANLGVFTGSDLLFTSNSSANYGTVSHEGGSMTLINSRFENNKATHAGALSINTTGAFTGTNLTFIGNIGAQYGGAIYSQKTLTVLRTGTFQNNSAIYGGAVTVGSGTFEGAGLVFISNTDTQASSSNRDGGAIYVRPSAAVNLSETQFTGNYSVGFAGAVGNESAFTGTNIIFTSNTAAKTGGAIQQFTGTASLTLFVTTGTAINYTGNTAVSGTGGFLYSVAGAQSIFDIASSGTLTIGAGGTADTGIDSIASADNTAAFTKKGGGDLVLNSDNSLWKGTIDIQAGRLLLGQADAKLNGLFSIGAAAVLGGEGAITDGAGGVIVTATAGATIQVGGFSDSGTLVIDGQLVLANATLSYVAVNGTSSKLQTTAISASGLNTLNMQGFATGTYNLGTVSLYTGLTTGGSLQYALNGGVVSESGRSGAARITDGTDFLLSVWTAKSQVVRWTGSGGNTWNTSASNWEKATVTEQDISQFASGDMVQFPGSAAGSQTIDIAGSVSVTGMTVDGTSTVTFNGAGGITGNAYQTGVDAEAAVQAGTGKLIKNGTGTLSFANTGGNDFKGGIEINSGVLAFTRGDQIQAGGSAIILNESGTLRAAASTQFSTKVVIESGKSSTIDTGSHLLEQTGGSATDNISGGTLVKIGSGTLALSKENAQAGTRLAAGTLLLQHNRALGANQLTIAANDTTLAVGGGLEIENAIDAGANNFTVTNVGAAATLRGRITSTTGVLTAAGNGLVFSGSNSLAGFNIASGANVTAGGIHALGGAASAVSVRSGGTLNVGIPGTQAGSLELDGGTIVFTGFTPTGTPLLTVTGSVTAKNGAIIALGGDLPSDTYTLIETPVFGGGDYTFDAGPNTDTILNYSNGQLTVSTIGQEINPGKDITATFNAIGASMNAVYSRISESFLMPMLDRREVDPLSTIWIKAVGTFADYNGDAGKVGFKDETYGMVAGYDTLVSDHLLLGAYFGYGNTTINTDNDARTDANIPQGGIYGVARLGKFYFAADAMIGTSKADTDRLDGTRRIKGSYRALATGASAEIGVMLASWERGAIKPAVSLHYMNFDFSEHREDGAGLATPAEDNPNGALIIDDFSADRLQSLVRLQATHGFTTPRGQEGVFDLFFGWKYNLTDDVPKIAGYYASDSTRFLVEGDKYSESAIMIGLGLRVAVTLNATIGLSYDYEMSRDYDRHTVNANVRWMW